MKRLSRLFILFCAVAGLTGPAAHAALSNTPQDATWVTNGTVNAVAVYGEKVYIGGSFTSVGKFTGYCVPFDTTTGTAEASYPKVEGNVFAVVPDGSGGWFIGGDFWRVGGVDRSRLAHILSDGSVDAAWNPGANALVKVLTLDSGKLYVGGSFTSIGGQTRNYIAALDPATGVVSAWNPNAFGTVNAFAVNGSTVYVGGSFTSIGGKSRSYIAGVDAATGLATTWNPSASDDVLALAVSGGIVYAGGQFMTIGGGQTRHYIAALDAATGLATGWNANASGVINSFAVHGSTVYTGGSCLGLGGQSRYRLAAIDTATGRITNWNPNANGIVNAVYVAGETVYAVGNFTTVGGQSRNNIAGLDATTGLATGMAVQNQDNEVLAVAVDGNRLYAGGKFRMMNCQARASLAALDTKTGTFTTWAPNPTGTVYSLAVKGNNVYVGGTFATIGGQSRGRIAAVDAATGLATAWNPGADSTVYSLALGGGKLYVSGVFGTFGGQSRNRIAAVDTATGQTTSWNPNANDMVNALAVDNGTVYAAGAFTSIGGQSRKYLAALSTTTGLATSWNPNPNSTLQRNTIAVNNGAVYVGGNFTSIGGQTRNYIAALSTATGLATSWNPNASAAVYSLAVNNGIVYVGGDFLTIGGQSRYRLAALNAASGTPTSWNPVSDNKVYTLAASGDTLYAGGDLTAIGWILRPYFAQWGPNFSFEATGISPVEGVLRGGTIVTITGSAIANDATVSFGGRPATNVTFISPTTLTCAAPAGAALGAVDVTVANPDGKTSTLAGAYTYAPIPEIFGVAPSSGPLAGGTTVTITGDNFAEGATLRIGENAITQITEFGATSIKCITPAGASLGAKDLVITNPDTRSATLAGGFTYYPSLALTAIAPSSGPLAGGTTVTITGAGFNQGATIKIGDSAVTQITQFGASSIKCVTPAGVSLGAADLTVSNTDGQSQTLAGVFTYYPSLVLNDIVPSSGPLCGGTTVTITGEGFNEGATIKIGVNAVTQITEFGATSIKCIAPAGASLGAKDVTVCNTDGQVQTLAGAFTYYPTLAVNAIAPSSGPLLGGTTVTITGAGFNEGATIRIGANAVTQITEFGASSIKCITPAGASLGAKDLTITNTDGQSKTLAGAFTYYPSLALTAIAPSSGPLAGGTTVTVTGEGFNEGVTIQIGGSAVTQITEFGVTSIKCITPAGASLGAKDLTVTNTDGQTATLAGAFTYYPSMVLNAIAPSSGPLAGGTTVTITGESFHEGATIKIGANAVTQITEFGSTAIKCITPVGASVGAKDVIVTNTDGQTETLAGAFTYYPSLALTAIAPSSGPLAGGTTVTITGAGFNEGATIQIGANAVTQITEFDSTAIKCITPAGASLGAKDVTVTNTDGQAATLAGGFTYYPSLSLAAIVPSSGPLAGGTTVTITGEGFNEGAAILIGASAVTQVTEFSATSIKCITPAGASLGAKDVTVSNTDGQSQTLAGAYAYYPPLVLSAIAPSSGPLAGGTTVTITGAGFNEGAAIKIGANAVTQITEFGSTVIKCITPAGASAGAKDVIVTNTDGQTETLAGAFTYYPSLALTAIAPSSGPLAGGTTVTITGAGFNEGATIKIGANAITQINEFGSTAIKCITPAGASLGAKDVTVTNTDGQTETLAGGFTYYSSLSLVAIAPSSGPLSGGTTVTITGEGFNEGATIKIGANAVTQITEFGSTEIKCITPAGASLGAKDVIVTNTDGQTAVLAGEFTYYSSLALTTIAPSSGPLAGGTTVTITGIGFNEGATIKIGANAVTQITEFGSTEIRCITPAGASLGAKDVTVTNTDGQTATLAGGFTYYPSLTLTAIAPSSGPLAGGTTVTITGAGFNEGATIKIGANAVTQITEFGSTEIKCITPAGASLGAKDVAVTNTDGQTATLTGGFTYYPSLSLAAIVPSSGPLAGGTTVTITGEGFNEGATIKIGANAVTQITEFGSTAIKCITPAGASIGAKDVIVTNTDGQTQTLAGAFTYYASLALTAVAPSSGPLVGGTTVSITGAGFNEGATIKIGANAVTQITEFGSTAIKCITPAGASLGAKDVTVTNTDGQAVTLAGGFTYYPSLALSAIAPSSGPLAGGTTVTITGEGFNEGATIKIGANAVTQITEFGSTAIKCITPAGASVGAKDVTVSNTDGQTETLAGGFTYYPSLSLTAIAPSSGPLAGGTTVTITGTQFNEGATIRIGANAVTQITEFSAASIKCITPAGVSIGAKDVIVSNTDGQTATLAGAFTYYPSLALTAIAPSSGPLSGGTTVTISGAGFNEGATIKIGANAVTQVTEFNSTAIKCITPAGASVGAKDVTVTNTDGQTATLAGGFTYYPSLALTAIAPSSGPLAGGTTVTITGEGFNEGATIKIGANAVTQITEFGSTAIKCITPAGASIGAKDVIVTNTDGQTAALAGAFTYYPSLSLTAIAPSSGPLAGGTTVTITGTQFNEGATIRIGANAVTQITEFGTTEITCITPAGASLGAKDVIVSNTDGQTATLAGGFTYYPTLSLTTILPSSGPLAGGTTVTITGAGFNEGATIKIGANTVTQITAFDAAEITCITPAGASVGAKDVIVANTDGQTATLVGAFTYYPSLSLTAILPSSGPLAGGTTVTISGAGFNEGATIKIGANAITQINEFSATSIECITPAGASIGIKDVTVTNTDGQAATLAGGFTYYPSSSVVSLQLVSAAPAAADQGSQVTLMKLKAWTDYVDTALQRMKFNRAGTLNDIEVSTITIYRDTNDNGIFNDGVDEKVSSGTDTFSGGAADIGFTVTQTLNTSTRTYFAVVNLSTGATPGKTVGLSMTNNTFVTVNAPNTVATNAFPFTTGFTTVNEPAGVVTATGTSVIPATVIPGDNNKAALKLSMTVDRYCATLRALKLNRTGTCADTAATVRLYAHNGGGSFDPAVDTPVSAAAGFAGGSATLTLNPLQTLTTDAMTLFAVLNISGSAVPGTTIGLTMTDESFVTVDAPDTVSSANFPIASGLATITATVDTVTVTPTDAGIDEVTQGDVNKVVETLGIQVDAHQAVWRTLRLAMEGTAADSDIAAVRVWRDTNDNGTLEPATDVAISTAACFIGGTAYMAFTAPETITTTAQRYLIAVDISSTATASATFRVTCSTSGYMGFDAPDVVAPAGFPWQTTQAVIRELPDTVTVTHTDLAAANIGQGSQNASFLKLSMIVDHDSATVTRLKVDKAGTLSESKVTRVRVFEDTDHNGLLDLAADTVIGSGVFVGGTVTMDLAPQTITPETQNYFITLSLAADADLGATIGVSIADQSYVTVTPPDLCVMSSAAISGLSTVGDPRVPTVPVVANEGEFTANFDQLIVTWASTVGEGTIGAARYAVGTSTSANDVRGWTDTDTSGHITINDLFLTGNQKYYVFVKARSSAGFWSGTGVSGGTTVDLVAPKLDNAPTVVKGQNTYMVTWPPAAAGISGITRYQLEVRTGTSPRWIVISTITANSAVAARTSVRAAPGTSQIFSNGNEGTYFYRVRAQNGAGRWSEYSPVSRVIVGSLPATVLSGVSSYPNPFDSRVTHATIHYALNQNTGVTITIYDLFGHLVREMSFSAGGNGGWLGSNEVQWDGCDDGGTKVSMGGYIARIKADAGGSGNEARLGIAVIH